MLGSQAHHQVPRYFSEEDTDPMAVGVDVFAYSWLAETAPYFCPPWTEITPMLEKIALESAPCMVVLPERPQALWWPLFASLRTDWWRCLNPLPRFYVTLVFSSFLYQVSRCLGRCSYGFPFSLCESSCFSCLSSFSVFPDVSCVSVLFKFTTPSYLASI